MITIDQKPNGDADTHIECEEIKEAEKLYDSLMANPSAAADDIKSSNSLAEIDNKVHQIMEGLVNCHTAKLWLQYLETIDIVCRFPKAERTGEWLLHLQAVSDMLPYFANSPIATMMIYLKCFIEAQ